MPEATQVTADHLRGWPLPEPGTDKNERGQVFVLGGSRTTPGAVLLATEAALRVGAGKVRLATVESCATALAVAAPELLVTGLAEDEAGSIATSEAQRILDLAEGCGTVLIGPGFTDVDASTGLLNVLMERLDVTVVLDALASAYVTQDPDRVASLPSTVVLTLNPTELARCLGVDEDEVGADPEPHTANLAGRTAATVLCGGTTKVVAHEEQLWQVEKGNPGLAISGSGDVQAGIVAGLLGRGAEPAQAAVWGGFLHAAAGDRLADRLGPLGYLSRELPPELPALLGELDHR